MGHLDLSVVENVLAWEDIVSSCAAAIRAARVGAARREIGIVHDYRRLGVVVAFARRDIVLPRLGWSRTVSAPAWAGSPFLTPYSVVRPLRNGPMGRSGW